MKQPPRNRLDHYLPQGYLKGFIDPARTQNDRPLWCLNKLHNQWERKSPKQICRFVGMYDFANDAIDAEHADVTFKKMEDEFPGLRNELIAQRFVGWKEKLDFLLLYLQMVRVRSPLFFVEQGQELAGSIVATITSVDHAQNKLTYDTPRRLSELEVHDMTLSKMREEFKKGSDWMADFHWQIRTTFDPNDAVVTSESPLFVKGTKNQTDRSMTMDILTDIHSEIWFPLCWQAALVGRVHPFESDLQDFDQISLNELRHIVAEMSPQHVISPQIIGSLILDGHNIPSCKSRNQ